MKIQNGNKTGFKRAQTARQTQNENKIPLICAQVALGPSNGHKIQPFCAQMRYSALRRFYYLALIANQINLWFCAAINLDFIFYLLSLWYQNDIKYGIFGFVHVSK